MARYLEVAADANKMIRQIIERVEIVAREGQMGPMVKGGLLEELARLYNLGIRTSPRAVQSTVRLNAVRRALGGLPMAATLEERLDEKTGRAYKALVLRPTNTEESHEGNVQT